MSEKNITQVEEKLDKVRDEIFSKIKKMSWGGYKNYLNRRTNKFAENLGVKLTPTQTPGVYAIK